MNKSTMMAMFMLMIWNVLTSILSTMTFKKHMYILNVLFSLITFSVFIMMNISMYITSTIAPFIMFLMMTGGVIVVFSLFVSLSSHHLTTTPFMIPFLKNLIINSLMNLMIFIYGDKLIFLTDMNYMNLLTQYKFNMETYIQSFSYLYSYPHNSILMLSILYLLIGLMLISKICNMNKKSLRVTPYN